MHTSSVSRHFVAIFALSVVLFALGASSAMAAAEPGQKDRGAQATGSQAPASALCALSLAPQPAMSPLTPAQTLLPASAPAAGTGTAWGSGFTGFCPCGCSAIRNCNTSADCFGGARCMRTPSCC
jgi:hypothetical protein